MTLKKFLLDLMNDPAKLAKLRKNPDAVLEKAKLSREEKAVIRSGDSLKIQALLGKSLGPAITHVVLQVSPGGPRPTPRPNPDTPPSGPRTPRPQPTRKHPSTQKPPGGDKHPPRKTKR